MCTTFGIEVDALAFQRIDRAIGPTWREGEKSRAEFNAARRLFADRCRRIPHERLVTREAAEVMRKECAKVVPEIPLRIAEYGSLRM